MTGKLFHLFYYFALTISTFAASPMCSAVIYLVILLQALSISSQNPWNCCASYLMMLANLCSQLPRVRICLSGSCFQDWQCPWMFLSTTEPSPKGPLVLSHLVIAPWENRDAQDCAGVSKQNEHIYTWNKPLQKDSRGTAVSGRGCHTPPLLFGHPEQEFKSLLDWGMPVR